MKRRSRRRSAAPENHERWLITYADLITLLLIFFVIMYAMSKIDVQKYETLAQALKVEFQSGGSHVLEGGAGIIGKPNPSSGQPGGGDSLEQDEQQQAELRERQLEDLLEKVQGYIAENNLQSQVSAANTSLGVAVTVNDLFLFDLGKADLKQAAYPILDQLASLLQSLDATISIEGHTDDLPLATGSLYKDNWGLSQARSLSVLRYFLENTALNKEKFISTAYADARPVAPNDSEENRAKNRRVEIVVLR